MIMRFIPAILAAERISSEDVVKATNAAVGHRATVRAQ
jgi:hypothetical protein